MNTKPLIFIAVLSFFIVSCQKENYEITPQAETELFSLKNVSAGNYDINATHSYVDGATTLTFVIDQSGAQDISHMLFQLVDCNGEYLTINNVTSVTVNGIEWTDDELLKSTTGRTGCEFDNNFSFIKLDNFNFDGGEVTVVITFSGKVESLDYKIKSATNCFDFSYVTDLCGDEKCYEFDGETAWAGSLRYNTRGNWATYVDLKSNGNTVTLYAGRTVEVGTASFSDVVDGKISISIELSGDWIFAESEMGVAVNENIKIQDYSSKPSGNPSPGLFAHKATATGKTYVIEVPASNFYGIHLDVGSWVEVVCAE